MKYNHSMFPSQYNCNISDMDLTAKNFKSFNLLTERFIHILIYSEKTDQQQIFSFATWIIYTHWLVLLRYYRSYLSFSLTDVYNSDITYSQCPFLETYNWDLSRCYFFYPSGREKSVVFLLFGLKFTTIVMYKVTIAIESNTVLTWHNSHVKYQTTWFIQMNLCVYNECKLNINLRNLYEP